MNAQAKDAARSLNDALAATVDMIGRQVEQWLGRGETTTTPTTPTTPTVTDAEALDPDELAARIDQQMEDAEGGIEASLLDAPDGTDAEPDPRA